MGETVPSVTRAYRLLEALAEGPPTATLASLSKRAGLARSSTLALCRTLVQAGLMERQADGQYRLGPRLLSLSQAYLAQTDIHSAFERAARTLDVLPTETVVLSVRDATDVVYVGYRAGSRPLGVSYQLGMRLSAHSTADGKALLATLPDDEVRALYADVELEGLTPATITDVDALLEDLAAVRRNGYALDDEEAVPGTIGIGAAVLDRTGHAAGAVAVSSVKAATTAEAREHLVAEILRLTAAISVSLGASAATVEML